MKIKILLWILIWVLVIPVLLYFLLPLPSPLPEIKVFGAPIDWLNFWPMYLSAGGTVFMSYLTYKTLKQNETLVLINSIPRLSCTLSVEKTCIGVKIQNTSYVHAHSVKVKIDNNTNNSTIFGFKDVCESLQSMSFEIPACGEKTIEIYGIEPHKTGSYDGFFKVTLSYHGKTESYDLYLKEISVAKWNSIN